MTEQLEMNVKKGINVWLPVFAAACFWTGLFAVILQPASTDVLTGRTQSPRVIYLSGPDAGNESQPRGLWSPLLFGLPSAYGFSALPRQDYAGIYPLLDAPREKVMFWEPQPMMGPPPPVIDIGDLAGQVHAYFSIETPNLAEAGGKEEADRPQFLVQYLDGYQADDFSMNSLPDELAAHIKPWQAILEIETGRDGEVGHVFLAKSLALPEKMGLELIRAVRRWRVRRDLPPRYGTVMIQAMVANPGNGAGGDSND